MSLKAFHIFFVTVSILFAAAFGGWELVAYSRQRDTVDLLLAIGSFLLAALLIVYFRWFLQKIRSVK